MAEAKALRWGFIQSAGLFTGSLALAITYLLSPASRPFRQLIERLLAQSTGTVLSLFDPSVLVDNTTVTINGFAAQVIPACTGLFTTAIFLAAVVAYPASSSHKLVGVGIGIFGLLAVNWIRIVSLLVIGGYWPSAFDIAHLLVWRSVVLAVAAFLWLGWARKATHG
ncbi:MAG: archaeosortase/exosortase family protein [Candidatus Bipolaricaulia bacterium]